MDYIDKIKKINAIAQELQKYGIEKDPDEAIKKAQEIMESGKDPTVVLSELKNPLFEIMDDENIEVETMDTDTLKKEILQAVNMKLEAELIGIREKNASDTQMVIGKVNEVIMEINKMEEKIIQLSKKVDSAQPIVQPTAQPTPTNQAPQTSHPRTGNFRSDEVDLTKMFYYGNKR